MESNRRWFKFEGKDGEDFSLWEGRPAVALEEKGALNVVSEDVVGD